jgi:cytochrome c oxidase assembly protein subunit 15
MFINLVRISIVLAFVVIVLGAYTRLTDSGLGCPDWPGCYGNLAVPSAANEIDMSDERYASRPLETGKAWNEMIHRYAAGTLGLCILAIAGLAHRRRKEPQQQVVLPFVLLGLVIFQALLGMWTVTLLLKPVVVMGHLLGGMTILLLLVWLYLKINTSKKSHHSIQKLVSFGIIVLYIQISLGGWTSANYAALVCPDLPTCQGQWWPEMDFKEGFVPWRGLGVNYEFGVLMGDARTAIHMAHRIGAIITLLFIGAIAIRAIKDKTNRIKDSGLAVLVLLVAQFCLGISNILFTLPLAVAVAHNGVAALLLSSMGMLLYRSRFEDE